MPAPLSAVSVQMFRDQFQIKYQAPREITGTTMEKRGVIGDAYKWPQMAAAIMLPRGAPSSAIPASILDHTRITTTFDEWVLNTPTDQFKQAEVNADEMSVLAVQHVKAIGRREDQTLIDSLDASAAATEPTNATNLTLEKLINVSKLLNTNNVDKSERTILIHANSLGSLLEDSTITSSDFNTVKLLMAGDIDTFMGFKFITIGDREEGGLPKTGDIRTCFAYNKQAVGMAWQIEGEVEVDWEPVLRSHLTISALSLGASALQLPGIVKIDCDETK